MFGRKFQRLAEQFQDAIFLDIIGDETNDTRVNFMRLLATTYAMQLTAAYRAYAAFSSKFAIFTFMKFAALLPVTHD